MHVCERFIYHINAGFSRRIVIFESCAPLIYVVNVRFGTIQSTRSTVSYSDFFFANVIDVSLFINYLELVHVCLGNFIIFNQPNQRAVFVTYSTFFLELDIHSLPAAAPAASFSFGWLSIALFCISSTHPHPVPVRKL